MSKNELKSEKNIPFFRLSTERPKSPLTIFLTTPSKTQMS